MKRLLLITLTTLSIHAIAQTNIFPSSGNVGIGTTMPQQTLTIDTKQSASNAGAPALNGDVQNGILRLQVNGNSWGEVMDFGMNILPSYAWIQATNRGNLGVNYNLALNPNGGNVGIGMTNPTEKLTIAGGHGDTKLRLYSTGNGGDMPANLSLWASEPGWTYYGTGIGYNVNGSPYYGRIDNNRGSSYVRFLPGETKFEFQNTSGSYINALTIKESGNVGIGTTATPQQLSLTGGIGFANQNAIDKKLYSPQDGTLEWLTHDGAGEHGFAVSHQGERRVYLNTKGNSYLIGGNFGIGTTNPDEKLTVNGVIHAKEVKVDLSGPLADFVFKPTYKLMPLPLVEQFVKANNHLPQMPSAEEVAKNGLSMGEMQNKLLQKVEELTLYSIEQEKKYNALLKKMDALTKLIEEK